VGNVSWNEILSGLFGGAGIVIIKSLFDWIRNRGKDKAEFTDIVTGSSERVMVRMEQRMNEMEREIRLLKKRELVYARNQAELIRAIHELKFIMEEAGIDYKVEPELEEVPFE